MGSQDPWKGDLVVPADRTQAQQRARIARASRRAIHSKDPSDRAEVDRLRSEYAADRLAAAITDAVSAAPSLTEDQCQRLASLLRPIPVAGGARNA